MGEERKVQRQTMLDNDSRYGPVAQALSIEVRQAIEPILSRYGQAYYCPREIGIVTHEVINEIIGLMLMIPVDKRGLELAKWR